MYLAGCTGLTSLPEGLTVGGSLDLGGCTGLTTLPEGLAVGGTVYDSPVPVPEVRKPELPLTWQDGRYILADGILSEVVSHRGNVYRTRRVRRTDVEYLVTDEQGRWAHGATLQEARDGLVYKLGGRDTSDYKGLPLDHRFSFSEAVECYRVITGACAAGVRGFVESRGISRDTSVTIEELIEITSDQYGNDVLRRFFAQN